MQGTTTPKKGTGHRPRVMVALRPAVYDLLTAFARKQRRAASWQLHNVLLERFVAEGIIDQARADELWDDVVGGKSEEGG